MPNQRDPNKVRIDFWLTKEEKAAIREDMKEAGIDTYTDYILYKLGREREADDEGEG